MDRRLSRLRANILSQLSREMHGAVTDYIGYQGEAYRVNLGVALHTIRSIAQSQERDKELAMMLSQDSARELILTSFWLINPEQVSQEELDFWAEGLINTEVCDEAAFALLRYVKGVERLLYHQRELVNYSALVAMSYQSAALIEEHLEQIIKLAAIDSHHISYGVVIALEQMAKDEEFRALVESSIEQIKPMKRGEYIAEELGWRVEELCFMPLKV